ncbi:MAG: nucleotide exchange factor GrpE [Pelagibacteraceae bacterium]|nr:nucleotide exchange factor GrpE [Pelagibacteraceae bacterium]|tara:strand:- start:5795 stop:6433 length:639 start_codon:yes stop_codon:yes gene_type:complete
MTEEESKDNQNKHQNDSLTEQIQNDKENQDNNQANNEDKETLSSEKIIENLKIEIDELKDHRLRAVAELDNFRKRSEKDQSDALKYSISNFAKEVVSIMDNIERAKSSINQDKKEEKSIKSVLEGIDLIHQSIVSVFEKFGIKKIDSINQKFDHNFHQAMMEVERDDCEPGIVVQELIPGYTIHDRLLRPAMVGVSKQTDQKTDISREKPSK